MNSTVITLVAILCFGSFVEAETNTYHFLKFYLLSPSSEITNNEDLSPSQYPWVKIQFSRSPQEHQKYLRSCPLRLKNEDSPVLAISQTPRMANIASGTYTNFFTSLATISELFNFNAVYTKISSQNEIKPGVALQLAAINFAIKNRYDIEAGPSYVIYGDKDIVEFGLTIKFLETPRLQSEVKRTEGLRLIPLNLSKFYIYIGGGVVIGDWEDWAISIGIGTRMGN